MKKRYYGGGGIKLMRLLNAYLLPRVIAGALSEIFWACKKQLLLRLLEAFLPLLGGGETGRKRLRLLEEQLIF